MDTGWVMDESAGPGGRFFALLAALRDFRAAHLDGDPSDRALARTAGVSPTTIGSWLAGTRFPLDPGNFVKVVDAIAARAAARGLPDPDGLVATLLDTENWRAAHRDEARRRNDVVSEGVQRRLAVRSLAMSPAGRLLAEVTDPFALEVHRAVDPDRPQPGLPLLPAYVSREHDRKLAEAIREATDGHSGIAVLVGASSTGKTRACWEALQFLRNQPEPWRLWHPIDPSRPEAALRELPSIGPRTVVWLNEAQFYLGPVTGGLGEQIASGLRELLRKPGRAPVLILATLWPEFWDRLTARPKAVIDDQHAQARELLSGRDISVPASFTSAQLRQLATAADPRLTRAAEAAEGGQIIQFLAGAPELMARYRNAPPPAAALISAAIDARSLGMGVALPRAFLEAAAPGYLSDTDWDGLDDDWLEQAMAYTAASCKGARGPLARMRPRLVDRATPAAEPNYRLADYLEQHGRRARGGRVPPIDFWKAAGRFANPDDLPALIWAAEDRGMLRDAASLRKQAAAQGNTREAADLVRLWRSVHPDSADSNPARWAAMHADLSEPYALTSLLNVLRWTGEEEGIAILLARSPGAGASVADPTGVARLLDALREAGAVEQADVLAGRAAVQIPVDDSYLMASMLDVLLKAGAAEHAKTLARRVTQVFPGDPDAITRLMRSLQAERTWALALHVEERYQAAETEEAMRANAPAASGVVSHFDAVRSVADAAVQALREAEASESEASEAHRIADQVPLDDPYLVIELVRLLYVTGDGPHTVAFAVRVAERVSIDDLGVIVDLVRILERAGAEQEAAALASRAAAGTPLGNRDAVTHLLKTLWNSGAQKEARTLMDRLPGEGQFDLFSTLADHQVRFRFGREPGGSPASPWGWDDLD